MYKYYNLPTRKCSPLIVFLVFLFGALSSIIDIVNALPDTVPNVPGSNTSPTAGVAEMTGPLTPHAIIVGIILIITGFIFCFFGRKIYHLTLFLIGFYVGAIAMWMALINNEPPGGYGGSNSNMTIILVVSLAAGLIVGMLFICCADFAVWLLGALAGYLFALFVLSWGLGGVIQSNTGRIAIIVTFALLGLLLTCFFFDVIIIIATAFIGAYAMILGVDMFVRTGFAQLVQSFLDGNTNLPSYEGNTKIYIMLAALVVAFILGAIFQYRYNRDDKFYPRGRAPTYRDTTSKFNMGKNKKVEKTGKNENPA